MTTQPYRIRLGLIIIISVSPSQVIDNRILNGTDLSIIMIDKYRAGVLIIPRDSKADVAIRVAGRIVQIQVQNTIVRAIVPIATAQEATQPRL